MHVSVSGERDARPLLFLHGGGVAGWMWRPTTGRLLPGVRLLVPDLPGHGRSSGEPYVSHARTVDELAGVIEEATDRPVTVVGFSLGAQLAVLLGANRPDLVDQVVAVSAQAIPTRAPVLTESVLRVAAPLARYTWFATMQARELRMPTSLLDDYLHTSRNVSTTTLTAAVGENIRFTAPPEWANFPGRALVLAGERERGFMKDSARTLSELLPGSSVEIVDGCGHGIPLERPDWFARRLQNFVAPAR
ncbi:alpha/beta fold hydrolase [Cellulosimicrobium cellulans]|uniref:alpha/beta fold hydrolase n=1 Tax=Cellulosimicrobium cellulans TaxID=1710 RepID=UPI0037FD5308